VSKDDQLAVIFEILGTPDENDISYVTDPKALTYLKSFNSIARVDLKTKYKGASEEAMDLLNKMLQFNPFFRISIDDALAHPVFKKVRKE
jgi:serine/threonine protein kinase